MSHRKREPFDENDYYDFDDAPKKRSRRGCILGMIGLFALFAVLIVFGYSRRAKTSQVLAQPTTSALTSTATSALIAVIPTFTVEFATPTAIFTLPPTLTHPAISTQPLGKEPFQTDELAAYMLELINADRQANGLGQVVLNEFASQVGQKHAEEMAANNYLAHWNLAGEGPDIRYALAGGIDVNMENVYSYYQRYDDGSPVPVADWKKLVYDAEQSLMESPGHRKNILDPGHTDVGIGLAYASDTGEFRIAQEFTNHYLELDPVQREAATGGSISIRGTLLPGASEPAVNLLYEPFPSPLTVDQLNQTSTYESPAVFLDASQPTVNDQGVFSLDIPIWPKAKPGFYHVVIWVMVDGQQVPAADVLVSVFS
jgi:uncharacterized protein YkwD